MEPLNSTGLRLVVIPSDSIEDYERAGFGSILERYYNPKQMFSEVYAISPLEKGERRAYGMTIRGIQFSEYPDVIDRIRPHVIRAYGGYWPADLACLYRRPDIPVVVSIHNSPAAMIHPSVRHADLVFCISDIVEASTRSRGVKPEKIRRLPNRVDRTLFHPIPPTAWPDSLTGRFPPGKHILHVGRKAPQKNLETLIRALAILPGDYMAVFVGRGDSAPYSQLAKEMKVEERCFWVESVSNSELPVWYSWCDCMCTPSRWEGFGIVFIEAAACGAAIVTSNVAPMNEYLTHDSSACLIEDYENPACLAEAVRRVCDDPDYSNALRTGAVKATEAFDLDRVDELEVKLYREAIALPTRSVPLQQRIDRYRWHAQRFVSPFRSALGSARRNLRKLFRA